MTSYPVLYAMVVAALFLVSTILYLLGRQLPREKDDSKKDGHDE